MNPLTASDVLVVIPAFNEQASVAAVIDEVHSQGYSLVVVNDGSTDETARIAVEQGARLLELPVNLGVGGALRAGFRFAVEQGFRAVVQIDADGQHPAGAISQLLASANESGAHMVIGSRYLDGDPEWVGVSRRFAMRVLARSASAAVNGPITDSTSGLRLIQQPLLGQFAVHFPTNYLGDTYEAVVAAGRAGYVVVEVPVILREREHGESTASTGSAIAFTLKCLGVALLRLHKKLSPHTPR